jgi:hypothetical protein
VFRRRSHSSFRDEVAGTGNVPATFAGLNHDILVQFFAWIPIKVYVTYQLLCPYCFAGVIYQLFFLCYRTNIGNSADNDQDGY